jgi:hypothetical protein
MRCRSLSRTVTIRGALSQMEFRGIIHMEVQPFQYLEDLVKQVARFVMANNLHRRGNAFHAFSQATIDRMNASGGLEGDDQITGGYAFVEEPNGKEGMVRLYVGDACNPKWGFTVEGGELNVDTWTTAEPGSRAIMF